jgi:hypothetical protein
MANCVICDSPNARVENEGVGSQVDCVRCGWYVADLEELADLKKERPGRMARLSHRVRKMQQKDKPVKLLRELIDKLISDPLPSMREQEESLLLLIGGELRDQDPSGFFPMPTPRADYLTAWVGAFSRNSLFEIVRQLREAGLIEWQDDGLQNAVRMKLTGWDRYEEIKRSPSQARLAFMAMPFDDAELDRVYKDFFKNAAAQAGYELRRLDERQPAGLIDDQLRVSYSCCSLSSRRTHNGKSWGLLGSRLCRRSRTAGNLHVQEIGATWP